VRKSRPRCTRCDRTSTLPTLTKNEGLCPSCHEQSKLPPFDDAEAYRLVRDLRRLGNHPERVLSEMRRRMQPPPEPRRWASAFEWHALDVTEYATRSWVGLVS
jgi:hypothetical protein